MARKKPEPSEVSLTIRASELHQLLGRVVPFADSGDTLPILKAVHVTGHGDYIVAAATDRYTLGVSRLHTPCDRSLDVMIPVVAAKKILSLFKATRTDDPDVALTFTRETVTVTGGSVFAELLAAAPVFVFRLEVGKYPQIGQLLTPEASDSAQPIHLNPTLLARFQKCVGRGEPITMRDTGRQVLVDIGEDFRGAIMQMHSDEKERPDWALLTDLSPADEAVA